MKHLLTLLLIIRLFIQGNLIETYYAKNVDAAKQITDKIQYHLNDLSIKHYIHIEEVNIDE